jgi:hypothetical protein
MARGERIHDAAMLDVRHREAAAAQQAIAAHRVELVRQATIHIGQPAVAGHLEDAVVEAQVERKVAIEMFR